MILDILTRSDRYQGLHPLFAEAFAWARSASNRARSDGPHAVRGDDLVAILQRGITTPAQDKRFESHRRYIDIQLNLRGSEIIEWCAVDTLAVVDDFKPDNDIRFHAAPSVAPTRLLVAPESYAIFWPEDAHKPCCDLDAGATAFHKIVFKVAVTPSSAG